jgi:site-specific recombinase XerD
MSIPEHLANRLQAYAFHHGLSKNEKFFNMNRQRVWQIVKQAGRGAGVEKRVYPHLLRHSDAIE